MKEVKIKEARTMERCLNCAEIMVFEIPQLYRSKGTNDDDGWDDDHSTIGVGKIQ